MELVPFRLDSSTPCLGLIFQLSSLPRWQTRWQYIKRNGRESCKPPPQRNQKGSSYGRDLAGECLCCSMLMCHVIVCFLTNFWLRLRAGVGRLAPAPEHQNWLQLRHCGTTPDGRRSLESQCKRSEEVSKTTQLHHKRFRTVHYK